MGKKEKDKRTTGKIPEPESKFSPNQEMPHHIKPMLATLVDEPFDNPEWIFETKWDGFRAIAEIKDGKVELYSRNHLSFNHRFPQVIKALQQLDFDVILDGEVVALNPEGKPDFQLMQNIQNKRNVVLQYYVFDLLYLNGYDITQLPLLQRKELLKKVLPESRIIRYSDFIREKGIEYYNDVILNHQEGVIAKKIESTYNYGIRSREWLKIKAQRTQEAIVCGYSEPKGSRKGFGALILGLQENSELIYIGHTGGGFTEESIRETKKLLEPLEIKECPFKVKPKTNTKAHWVKPHLVCQVTFSEWTNEGILRHPIFSGFRPDKTLSEVKREIEVPAEKTSETKPANIRNKNKRDRKPLIKKEVRRQRSLEEEGEELITVENKKLRITNRNKIYWPKENYSKGDLLDYYFSVADFIVPYLKDRPQSLNRFPDGIEGHNFYQKNLENMLAEWVKTIPIYSEHEQRIINYFVCEDKASLLYMVNLGCIEINPWSSRIQQLDYPDYLILDLDPHEIKFEKVIETALVVKEVLDSLEIESFVKTSGATGLHIMVPLGTEYTFTHCRQFGEIIASLVHTKLPKITSLFRNPSKRINKVYIDFLQNGQGQTMAGAYSVRPLPEAPVSAPLRWDEVRKGLSPLDFTIKTMEQRLKEEGDLLKGLLEKKTDMEACLLKLEGMK